MPRLCMHACKKKITQPMTLRFENLFFPEWHVAMHVMASYFLEVFHIGTQQPYKRRNLLKFCRRIQCKQQWLHNSWLVSYKKSEQCLHPVSSAFKWIHQKHHHHSLSNLKDGCSWHVNVAVLPAGSFAQQSESHHQCCRYELASVLAWVTS